MAQDQPKTLEQQMADFTAQHPDVAEAMRIFGISTAQYARAMAALTHRPTLTTSSTDEVAEQ